MPETGSTVTATIPVARLGINANTPIIFTVKSFLATLGSLLSLLVGFYFAVLVPSMKTNVEHQKELYEQQKEYITTQFNGMKKSMDKNTNAIGINTSTLNATNARFNDLNTTVGNLQNTSGGFGDNTSSSTDGVATDPSLAGNPN